MSCGKHHDTPCTEVYEVVQSYLDGELTQADCERIRLHLDECGPCLTEADLDRVVKTLVARSCGCEAVPDRLRSRIVASIHSTTITVVVSGTSASPDAAGAER